MGDLTKSILLGVLTIGTWITASYFLNTPKEIKKENIKEIVVTKDIKKPFLETLTVDYKGTIK